jgi:hypothetical protein
MGPRSHCSSTPGLREAAATARASAERARVADLWFAKTPAGTKTGRFLAELP